MTIIGWVWINNNMFPALFAFGETQVDQDFQNIFNEAVNKTLANCDYNSLMTIQKGDNGTIENVSANADGINTIENKTLSYAQNELSSITNQGVNVNWGSAVSSLTTGMGPEVRINIKPEGNIQASYSTSYETAGINQTRMKIIMNIREEMLLLLGVNTKDMQFSSDILICDTIIPGNIPESNNGLKNPSKLLKLLQKNIG
jgi:Sporulation protein YunB (Spo_YunB).